MASTSGFSRRTVCMRSLAGLAISHTGAVGASIRKADHSWPPLNVGEILEARLASLSAQSAGVGIAVELMSAAGPKFVAAGSLGSARRSPGRETVFEIGSVT